MRNQCLAAIFAVASLLTSASVFAAATARQQHTTTLLPNGMILIAGGNDGTTAIGTAEIYDPRVDFSTPTGTMITPRSSHTATLLTNGKVLIAGGWNAATVATCELYDPVTGTFTTTGSLATARSEHTATLLPNGKVLVAGGLATATSSLSSVELYDPSTGTFSSAGTMTGVRNAHTASLLPNGKVFIAGGQSANAGRPTFLKTTELYDPAVGASGTFTVSTSLSTARRYHSATVLPNGTVLLAGGATVTTAEIYTPSTQGMANTTGAMASARFFATATLLPNGTVMIAGGVNGTTTLNTVEVYSPSSGTFSAGTSLATAVQLHSATLLPDSRVLISGGSNGTNTVATTQLLAYAVGSFTATGSLITSRSGHTATLLKNGKVLIAGGASSLSSASATCELYDPATGAFTSTGSMSVARRMAAAALLHDGRVVIAGGFTVAPGSENTAEIYDPATGVWTPTGNTTEARPRAVGIALENGRVLVVGEAPDENHDKADVFDPATGTFTATSHMYFGRQRPVAIQLPDGKVLVTGANGNAEIFNPASNNFNIGPSSLAASDEGTLSLVPGRKILWIEGPTAQLLDLRTNVASTAGTPVATRYEMTATTLPNGKVLIVGGQPNSVDNGTYLNSAELYDPGLAFSDARRPVVTSFTNQLCQPGNLSLSGSSFTSDSEGSNSGTNNSSTSAALLRVARVDNEQPEYENPQTFSPASFFSATISGLPTGLYRSAIVSNSIPSVEELIEVGTTPLLGTYTTASVNLNGSTIVTPTLPAGYNGSLYPITASASTGFTGSLTINPSTGVVAIANAAPVGNYTITISSSTRCGSPSTTFALKIIGPPAAITATGGTPQTTAPNTTFAQQLKATVTDSAGHPLPNVAVVFAAPSSGASASVPGNGSVLTDSNGVASITATANGIVGSYNVTATVGAFEANFVLTNGAPAPSGLVAQAISSTSVSISWNPIANATYEVVRVSSSGSSSLGTTSSATWLDQTAAADTAYLYKVRVVSPGTSSFSDADLTTTVIFTDSALSGIRVKAAHLTELRTAVSAVRTLAGAGSFAFTDQPPGSGITAIKAGHINELWTALNAARSTLSLPPISYTHATISSGSVVSAVDVYDLRQGVQ